MFPKENHLLIHVMINDVRFPLNQWPKGLRMSARLTCMRLQEALKEVSEYFPFPEHRKCHTSLYQKNEF